MASQARTIKLPAVLAEAAEIRATRLKYPSTNAYWLGLLRFDLLVQGDHPVSLPIAQSRAEERDQVDAMLGDLTKEGIGVRGAFIVGLLKDISKGKFNSPEEVGAKLVEIMLKQAKEKKEGS